MKKRQKIIAVIIISTIISLVYTFFSYFGINRYLLCHLKNSESFIENYSNLPKASDDRIVISFSVTPEKINKLKPFINSILDQTVKVDLIAMIIIQDENNPNTYDIPKYIKNVANVFPAGREYGKGTKIIPMLLREKECGTIIIALDENKVYGQDFIYSIVEEYKKNPDSVLIDNKGYAMLINSEHYGCDVIDRKKENFDNDWFLSKASKSKTFNYTENYKIIGF